MFSVLAVSACNYEKEDLLGPPVNCDPATTTFAAHVNPIIQGNCTTGTACHGQGSSNGPGALLTYDQIESSAESIKAAVVSRLMPQGSSLTTEQINTISCWVDQGAPNN